MKTAGHGPYENARQAEASRALLEESQKEPEPYEVEIAGLSFLVEPGVFSPKYFDSTRIFSPAIPVTPGEHFLEIGCGTGATSIVVARRGAARVLALDINPAAVANTVKNIERHRLDSVVHARLSDVFGAVSVAERFNTIYWNLPFIYVGANYQYRSLLERALFDPDYVHTRRFLSEGRHHLRPSGRLLVGFADFGDLPLLMRLAAEYRWSVEELTRGTGTEGGPVTFILFRFTPNGLKGI